MSALHIISQPDALPSCLQVAGDADEILLIGAAARLAAATHERPTMVLIDDLPTNCSLAPGISSTDYPGFVDLVARHKPIISWR